VLAFILERMGRLAEAQRELEAGIRISLDGRVSALSGLVQLNRLALLLLKRGELAGARQASQRALDFAVEHQLVGNEATSRAVRARLLLAEAGAKASEAARAEIERAEALARERKNQLTLALVEETRAELADCTGDRAARERALRDAARYYRACGDRWAAEQVDARLRTEAAGPRGAS
jgi:hypothetical protein